MSRLASPAPSDSYVSSQGQPPTGRSAAGLLTTNCTAAAPVSIQGSGDLSAAPCRQPPTSRCEACLLISCLAACLTQKRLVVSTDLSQSHTCILARLPGQEPRVCVVKVRRCGQLALFSEQNQTWGAFPCCLSPLMNTVSHVEICLNTSAILIMMAATVTGCFLCSRGTAPSVTISWHASFNSPFPQKTQVRKPL